MLLVATESVLSIIACICFIITMIHFVTLFVHHLPRGLQSSVSYLLLGKVLLGFSHWGFFLFLHFEHLLLILKGLTSLNNRTLGWSHIDSRVPIITCKSRNVVHQILFLLILLANYPSIFTPESVVLHIWIIRSVIITFDTSFISLVLAEI